nr:hypothetical protein [Pseudonocardia sp. Ae717_Ps2]
MVRAAGSWSGPARPEAGPGVRVAGRASSSVAAGRVPPPAARGSTTVSGRGPGPGPVPAGDAPGRRSATVGRDADVARRAASMAAPRSSSCSAGGTSPRQDGRASRPAAVRPRCSTAATRPGANQRASPMPSGTPSGGVPVAGKPTTVRASTSAAPIPTRPT